MNNLIDAHYFSLPTQGNIYSYSNLCLTSGINKSLFATLKRKVFCCEFNNLGDGSLKPVVKEVPFTYIPSGAEIISIDAFNRAQSYDDFLIGITIVKVNGGQSVETYLNIYSEQDNDEKEELNLDSIAQNCLMLELSYIPYQLYHTSLFLRSGKTEVVWLLCGGDSKVHLFREDPSNHAYSEIDATELFPEFSSLPGIPVKIDIKNAHENRRLSAIGLECGLAKFCIVDTLSSTMLMEVSEQYNAPVICMTIFSLSEFQHPPPCLKGYSEPIHRKMETPSFNLVTVNTLQQSVVYMDIEEFGLSKKFLLPESDKFDVSTTSCVCDVDMDGKMEILLGNYSQVLLVYRFEKNVWVLSDQKKMADPIHSIDYRDINNDGVKEIILLTLTGFHILQHNPLEMETKFHQRFQHLCNVNNEDDCSSVT